MRTDELQRTKRARDPFEVSRALQDLSPRSLVIVDHRNRPVPLTYAGYVLRFGKSYRLRVQFPFPEEEIQAVRIVNPPSFMRVEPELRETDEEGRPVHSLPFKVILDWDLFGLTRKIGLGIHAEELEMAQSFRPHIAREDNCYRCPVVARPRWTMFFLALLLLLGYFAWQNLVPYVLAPEKVQATLEPLQNWGTWLLLAAIVVGVWGLITATNAFLLYRRSRELWREFCKKYPSHRAVARSS